MPTDCNNNRNGLITKFLYIMENTMKDYHEENELIRKDLWCKIAYAYVNSSNSQKKEHASTWADHILSEFDKRFKELK